MHHTRNVIDDVTQWQSPTAKTQLQQNNNEAESNFTPVPFLPHQCINTLSSTPQDSANRVCPHLLPLRVAAIS
jgi:hypothetical protein